MCVFGDEGVGECWLISSMYLGASFKDTPGTAVTSGGAREL